MKTKLKIATLIVGVVACLTSCTPYDMVGNVAQAGQMAPNVYWELASSSVAAGDDVAFKAQYYHSLKDVKINHLEVWYRVDEVINTTVKCPLIATSFAISTNAKNVTRDYERVATYEHHEEKWDSLRRSFPLDTTFATSKTLAGVAWVSPEIWDAEKFKTYFPETLPQLFKDSLKKVCDKGYTDYRSLLVKTNQINDSVFQANFLEKVWDENAGDSILKMIPDSLVAVQALFDKIDFQDLIFNAGNGVFDIEYTKDYTLTADLRVIDEKGIVGKTESKLVELR